MFIPGYDVFISFYAYYGQSKNALLNRTVNGYKLDPVKLLS